MDKREFLHELEKYLAILDEKEQQDILDEYSQHIEMKMKSGMSEEEAIRDFGDINELAVDILGAYHVKPQYDGRGKQSFEKVKKEGKKVYHTAADTLVGTCRKGKGIIIKCRRGMISLLKKPFMWINGFLKNRSALLSKKDKQERENMEKNNGFVTGVKSFLINFTRDLISFCRWILRWTWNAVLFCISLFTGITALMALFFMGTMGVLLASGYPLTGVTLICLGVMLSAGAFTVFCFSLIKRGSKETKKEEVAEHA